ncbi:MAG: hypothetical protein QE285_09695 [Aquabacterium sp.]|nr:hypothetical protein [Aquabacterium sp.]
MFLVPMTRHSAGLARSFDQAECSASMEHGVLTLQLAKRGAS